MAGLRFVCALFVAGYGLNLVWFRRIVRVASRPARAADDSNSPGGLINQTMAASTWQERGGVNPPPGERGPRAGGTKYCASPLFTLPRRARAASFITAAGQSAAVTRSASACKTLGIPFSNKLGLQRARDCL